MHMSSKTKFKDHQSVTVWCMVSSSGVVDYNINFQTMNSERYCHVLNEKVIPFFKQRRHLTKIYQQDGAPPHYSLAAREILNRYLPDRWIGRRGPTEWPARSPDPTVCDFFLRDKVYNHMPSSTAQLARRIEQEIQKLEHTNHSCKELMHALGIMDSSLNTNFEYF